ncbi:MAG: hypothetical protein IJW00_02500 [Clostridia bacterium]|nr:hypothetical protein [Clostridia bacterium]
MDRHYVIRFSTSIFFAVTIGVFAALTLLWAITVDLTTGLVFGAFVTIPAAVLAWFILSLVLYLRAKKRGDDDLPALKHRLKTSVILLIFLAVIIALLVAFFAYAISHM